MITREDLLAEIQNGTNIGLMAQVCTAFRVDDKTQLPHQIGEACIIPLKGESLAEFVEWIKELPAGLILNHAELHAHKSRWIHISTGAVHV